MWLLILEALLALSILLFAVWWTMFSGRRRDGEGEGGVVGADPAASDAAPGQPQSGARDEPRR